MNRKRRREKVNGYLGCALTMGLTAMAVISSSGMGSWGAQAPDENPLVRLGEITCQGPTYYRTGHSPWVMQRDGSYPMLTPLNIKTQNSRTRFTFGPRHIFEVGQYTEFLIYDNDGTTPTTINDPNTSDILKIKHEKGVFLYAIPERGSLRVDLPPRIGGVAIAGIQPEFEGQLKARDYEFVTSETIAREAPSMLDILTAMPVRSSSIGHIGIIQVDGRTLRLFNVKGTLVYYDNDTSFVLLAATGLIKAGGLASISGGFIAPAAAALAMTAVAGGAVAAVSSVGVGTSRRRDRSPTTP
jgi:hypothetical protein